MLVTIQNAILAATADTLLIRSQNSISSRERNKSWWSEVPLAPPDSIFGLVEAFNKDPSPHKVNLAVGAYRDDDGQPYVLPCVKKAELRISAKNANKEYGPIAGMSRFCEAAVAFALGKDNDVIRNGLNATVQTLSGTGALSLFASFAKAFFPGDKTMYMPKPTWGNHASVFNLAGLTTKEFRYYDLKKHMLDYDGMLLNLCQLPDCSMVLLHGCAHNPTGTDPSKEQWKELSQLAKEKNFYLLFDLAYQGFATGNIEEDAFAVRQFAKDGHRFALSQSFSKNMGLYGERVGVLTILADAKEEVVKVISQLKDLARGSYSNPPVHGARIVVEIMNDQQLCEEWHAQMKGMTDRVASIRKTLRDELKKAGSKHNWDHIVKQIGMFCLTGLSPEQADRMIKDFNIYLTKDGRINIAGVSTKNVEYLACAMHQVTA